MITILKAIPWGGCKYWYSIGGDEVVEGEFIVLKTNFKTDMSPSELIYK